MIPTIYRNIGYTTKSLSLAVIFFSANTQANDAESFHFNPNSIADISGGAFTANTLQATEVSVIDFYSPTNPALWTENGYAQITAASSIIAGTETSVATPGLNNTYTLYAQFSGTGYQNSLTTGLWTSLNLAFYLVNGASSFSIDDITNTAKIDNIGNTPIKLLDSSLISGTTGETFNQTGGIDFSAGALNTLNLTPAGQLAFGTAIASELDNLYGTFFHPASGIFPAGNLVKLIGGNDNISFIANASPSNSTPGTVPLPGTMLLFSIGLSLMAGAIQKKRTPLSAG